MLRCFLSECLLAVLAWLCVIGGVDLRAALLGFDGAGAMGVAASIWLRTGCVSIGVTSRFLAIAQSSGSVNGHPFKEGVTRHSRAFQTSGPRVEDAETANYRSRASSQRDTNHAMRLTGLFKFEQSPILLRGPLFVAVLGHGTHDRRGFRNQHREDQPVP
jgi:hypothetical protein